MSGAAFVPRSCAGAASGLRIENGTTQSWNSRRLAPTIDARPIRGVRVESCSGQTVVRVHPRRCSAGRFGALGQDGSSSGSRQWRGRWPRRQPPATAALVRRPLGEIPAGLRPLAAILGVAPWGETSWWYTFWVGSAPAVAPALYHIYIHRFRFIDRVL